MAPGWARKGVYEMDWACGQSRENFDFSELDQTVGE